MLETPCVERTLASAEPQAVIPKETIAAAPSAPASAPNVIEYGTRRALVVAGVMLAVLLQSVDATIVNVALPTIQGNLGASIDEATWIITAYVIANVVVIPLTPWLQMRFGRKPYFLASILGFTIASVLCGISTSLEELIFFRVVQGAFGGGLLATAQVILRETFPPKQLGLSQSLFALGTVLGPSIGPTLGGIITDNLSWPWIFAINLPPGLIAFTILLLVQRAPNTGKSAPLDVPGILLLIVSVGSLQYVLDEGQRADWFADPVIVMFALTAALATCAFVFWELRTPLPIVDLRILARRPVAVAALLAIVAATAIFGVLLLLPQYTVGELGFTDTLAGILIGVRAIPIAILALVVGRITSSPRVSLPLLIGGGLCLAGSAAVWLSTVIVSDLEVVTLARPLVLMGLGIAFIYSPLLVSALRSVAVAESAKAASFVSLALQLGGSIAAALLVALVERRTQFHEATLASSVNLHRSVVSEFLAHHDLASLNSLVATQATTMAYSDAFFAIGVLGLLGAPLTLLLRRRKTG